MEATYLLTGAIFSVFDLKRPEFKLPTFHTRIERSTH